MTFLCMDLGCLVPINYGKFLGSYGGFCWNGFLPEGWRGNPTGCRKAFQAWASAPAGGGCLKQSDRPRLPTVLL